jgi:hypothetical protein
MGMIMVAMVVMVASSNPRGVAGEDSLLAVLDSTMRAMEGGGVYNRCYHQERISREKFRDQSKHI